MGTYDFDRFKDNGNTYICKDTQGRELINNNKTDTDKQINDLKESLKDRYVLIGDSYLDGYTPDGTVENFGIKLKRLLNKSDDDFVIVSHGGTGFVNVDASGKSFLSMIDDAYSATKNPESITHVIFAGGYNDQTYTSERIQSAIINAYDKVRAKFPKATMYTANVASTFNSNQASILYNLHDHVQHAFTYSALQGQRIVNLGYIGNCLHERNMLSTKDGIHPTDYGQGVIATALYYKLNGSQYFPVGRSKTTVCAYKDEYGNNSNITFIENYSNDTLTIAIQNIYFFTKANIKHESPYFVAKTAESSYVRGGYDTIFAVEANGVVGYNGGGTFKNVPITVGLHNSGNFFIKMHGVNDAGDKYEDFNQVQSIVFNHCFIRVPLSYS